MLPNSGPDGRPISPQSLVAASIQMPEKSGRSPAVLVSVDGAGTALLGCSPPHPDKTIVPMNKDAADFMGLPASVRAQVVGGESKLEYCMCRDSTATMRNLMSGVTK